ncbi:MAG: OadG family protein [Odoribacteraceae bacterium]|nr:OadG family protein [Odoribacteraceae bacterium]
MMIKRMFLATCLLAATMSLAAREDEPARDSYDPLVPQLFAVDNKHNVFAGINSVDNTVDLMRVEGKELACYKSVLVDVFKKRHDVHNIYRPKSVAIYEGHVVFLASHRDSCYLSVLNFAGDEVRRLVFAGSADAFSYSPEARQLYIAGEIPGGYDLVALDARRGIENVSLDEAAARHYRKPMMAEQIGKADPLGIGMAAIAMSVVFLGLMLLYLIYRQSGRFMSSGGRSREREKKRQPIPVPGTGPEGDALYAAIAAAIHVYSAELHDEEAAVLTINRVSRTYSPWSSKIHGLNTYFNKK